MSFKYAKAQKILLWIPVVNASVFFLWIIHMIEARSHITKRNWFMVGILALLLLFVATSIEYAIFDALFTSRGLVGYLYTMIITYIAGLTMGIILICSQKVMCKLYERENHNDD